ncbi:MAG TPA: hypothetical protein VKF62_09000, partial [Planctomycetota bacterium]|nr:hypothetical protein [Planctomycetota bacterium]
MMRLAKFRVVRSHLWAILPSVLLIPWVASPCIGATQGEETAARAGSEPPRIASALAPRASAGEACLPPAPEGGEVGQTASGSDMLARLPLAFVENRGQWDTPARFVARRAGLVVRIEEDALVLQLIRREGADRFEGVVVRLAFEGALETVALEGEGRQPGIHNF